MGPRGDQAWLQSLEVKAQEEKDLEEEVHRGGYSGQQESETRRQKNHTLKYNYLLIKFRAGFIITVPLVFLCEHNL